MYNKVVMVGNLTRDVELRYLPSGAAIAKSAIASSYKYKTATGEQKDEVCFLDFNIFGRSAEVANQYLRKGSRVLLEGRLVFEQWTAQDGTNRNRHSLRVDVMKMLDSKADGQNNDQRQQESYGGGGDSQRQQNPQYNNSYNNNSYNNNGQGNQNQGVGTHSKNPESNHDNKTNSAMNQNIPEINIDEDEIPF